MRYALAGLFLLAAAAVTGTPAQAHDRNHRPYYAPYPPPVRYVVPPPRYYRPPPAYYYAPAPVYAYPRHPHYGRHRAYGHHRPHHYRPRGSATFFFKF